MPNPIAWQKHFDALIAGTRAIGELPGHMRCKDGDTTARVHDEEATQVRQKILQCLDMRVLDRDLVVPTCLRNAYLDPPPLVASCSCTSTRTDKGSTLPSFRRTAKGFLQPRGDIRTSIVPRDFCQLPVDVQPLIDQYL